MRGKYLNKPSQCLVPILLNLVKEKVVCSKCRLNTAAFKCTCKYMILGFCLMLLALHES
uniref:Uncharacterized protein n=1 Tax=Octopus bimaculoides TaxID=37653 RepID=A0A0L8HM38_OCTBM